MSLILLLLKHENNIAFFKKIFGIIILFLDIILTFIILYRNFSSGLSKDFPKF